MADDPKPSPVQVQSTTPRASAFDLLTIAAWFGLVTGLLEGLSRTALQKLGGVSWDLLLLGTSAKIVWAAPLFYVPLFLLGGLLLVGVHALLPRLPMKKAAVFLFGLVGFANVLSGSGRLSNWGIAVLALGLTVVALRWFDSHATTAMAFFKHSLVWLVAGTLIAFAGIEAGIRMGERRALAALPPAAPGAPNVLVILVDALRADHLSVYGYPRKTSPNLERIAGESVLFENAIAAAPWTLPSHTSILTGLYPCEHSAKKFGPGQSQLFISEVLQERGYRTAVFSANAWTFSRAHGFGQGFNRFEDAMENLPDMFSRTLLGGKVHQYVLSYIGFDDRLGRRRAAEINADAVRWLEQDRDRPFFVFLNYFDLHDPYVPPQPYRSAFSKKKSPGGEINKHAGRYGSMGPTDTAKLPREFIEDEMAAYDGAVLYADEQIARLLGDLDRLGLRENTIVIITSDHGELFGEHGLMEHGTSVYRGVVHVPLIVRWPGKIPAGQRVDTPVSQTSLPATIMTLITGTDGDPFRKPSLSKLWGNANAQAAWPEPWSELAACPEYKNPELPCHDGELISIVSRDWFFIYHEKRGVQLYDQKQDPSQLNDLSQTPEGRKLTGEFLARIKPKHNHADEH